MMKFVVVMEDGRSFGKNSKVYIPMTKKGVRKYQDLQGFAKRCGYATAETALNNDMAEFGKIVGVEVAA